MFIAASGLSEAAWQADMAILNIGLLFAIGLNIVFLMSSRRLVLTLCLIAYAAIAFLLQPWTCFYVFSALDLADPDVAGASVRYRQIGFLWAAAIVVLFASVGTKAYIGTRRAKRISLENG